MVLQSHTIWFDFDKPCSIFQSFRFNMTREAVKILCNDSEILKQYYAKKFEQAIYADFMNDEPDAMINLFMMEQEAHHTVLCLKPILLEALMIHTEEFMNLWT